MQEYGLEEGKKSLKREHIAKGKGGRTREEQVISRFNSRVNKKVDAGYRLSTQDAHLSKGDNALGHRKAMLAQHYDPSKKIDLNDYVIQRKYNGYRCCAKQQGLDRNIAYSRNGKELDAVAHIFDGMVLPLDVEIDGELYAHGVSFERFSSLAKKKQEGTKDLKYIIYDIMLEDKTYEERYEVLVDLFNSGRLGVNCQLAETYEANAQDPSEFRDDFMDEGFEGAMLRLKSGLYESGKKSKNLLKVKKRFDEEYKVYDIEESPDGLTVLLCVTNSGETFKVTSPGTRAVNKSVLIDKYSYIDKYINIEFPNLTKRGVPFHPVAMFWRNKYEE